MTGVRIADPRTLTTWQELRAAKPKMIYYSARTCWWTTDPDDLCCPDGHPMRDCDYGGIPLDPAGAPIFQLDDVELEQFLMSAEAEAEHYGRHGLDAFVLAYAGNVIAEHGLARCATDWELYNGLLDAQAETACGILEECDLQLLSDITQESEDVPTVPCWSVGWAEDRSAGLLGGTVELEGNFFRSMDVAYSWIAGHEVQLRAECFVQTEAELRAECGEDGT